MGERFGPYLVDDERLGVGGMAFVHRAVDSPTRREVALKRLLPHHLANEEIVAHFVREGRLGARLRHPNIVQIYEQGHIDGVPYIAMELVRGDVLMVLMRRIKVNRQPPPIGVVLSIAIDLCEALDYAQFGVDDGGQPFGLIHRDLTPSNVVITNDGGAKLIDFGVAKTMRGEFVTDSGLAKGKLGYMSPEAQEGSTLDGRADIFSLGVVLWELVVGRRLFNASSEWETVERVRAGNVPAPSSLNPRVPSELDDLLLRALAKDYVDRWASAAAMRVELEHLRRYYSDGSTQAEVAAWKARMMALPPRVTRKPNESDTQYTVVRLSSGDLEEIVDDWAQITDETPEVIVEQVSVEAGESLLSSFDSAETIRVERIDLTDEMPRLDTLQGVGPVTPRRKE